MVLRCIGHGFRVGIVQFVKGAWGTGERTVLARFPELVTCRAMGEGFTWDTQDRARDIRAARAAWETAKAMMADPSYRMVLLDELNIVLRYDYLDTDEVVAAPDVGQFVRQDGRPFVAAELLHQRAGEDEDWSQSQAPDQRRMRRGRDADFGRAGEADPPGEGLDGFGFGRARRRAASQVTGEASGSLRDQQQDEERTAQPEAEGQLGERDCGGLLGDRSTPGP